jgi:iron(III) transport system ATP-binding protein
VRAQHRGVGYVPQEGALFPHLTVRGNIGFGLARRDRDRVDDLLALVGLTGLGRRYPHQLSGGQQQRVALARALAVRPSVVLLDEPFSSLDAALRASVRHDVARVLAETAATTILVTHDQEEALALADQVAMLRDGRIIACAEPRTLYRSPPDPATAAFLGEANILPATLLDGLAHCILGRVVVQHNGSAPTDGPSRLLLRPEQLLLHTSPVQGAVNATVGSRQFHGHDTMINLTLSPPNQAELVARVPGDLTINTGQTVWIEIRGPARAWPD